MNYCLKKLTGAPCNIKFESDGIDCLEEIISDNLSEEIDEAVSSTIESFGPRGFFPDPYGIAEELYKDSLVRLCKMSQDYSLVQQNDSVAVPILPVLKEILTSRLESPDIDIGWCVLSMLKKFLARGKWRFGLRNEKSGHIVEDPMQWHAPSKGCEKMIWRDGEVELNPILWFGIDGESPIECWTIDRCEYQFQLMPYAEPYNVEWWKSFWFNHFWSFDWNILFDDNGEGIIIWMFAECGMEEPREEFERVKASCPLRLCEEDSRDAFCRKIDGLFIDAWNEARNNG